MKTSTELIQDSGTHYSLLVLRKRIVWSEWNFRKYGCSDSRNV